MERTDYKPDPRIAEYVAEIEQHEAPFVNTSHVTLHRISCQHGHDVISNLLDEHFRIMREINAKK